MNVKNILILGVLVFALVLVNGCANRGQTGALVGALAGAAVGGQLGPDDLRGENALIGSGIGLGLGYILGNEQDKYYGPGPGYGPPPPPRRRPPWAW